MDPHESSLTIEELAELTQTPVRTVRYYIAEKMLPGPGARGKGAAYTEEHLLRLRLIRRLTERREPLAEIRELMARVTDDEIRALLAEEDARAQTLETLEQATRAVSPKAYISALLEQARTAQKPEKPAKPAKPQAGRASYGVAPLQPPPLASGKPAMSSAWRHVELVPGVELHIEARAERRYRTLIDRLLRVSKEHDEQSNS